MSNDKNSAQKKYLSEKRKQLRVWVENQKYEQFRQLVSDDGESIYSVINSFIDSYIEKHLN